MRRNMRKFVIAAAVLILVLGIATLAAAGPPGLTRNIGPPEHAQAQWENGLPPGLQDKGTPPGLQDKGGLPPGMHGREVLPPGIQMRFVNTLQGQWEGKEAGFYILGSEYIIISQEEPITEIYQAVLVDEAGEGDEAEDYDASLQVELYHQEIAAVEIIGAESIELPAEGEITAEYTANVLDQYEQIMIEGAAVRWWLGDENGEDMDGISLDAGEDTSTMATLTFTDEAAARTLLLWAAYAENEDADEIEGSLDVEIFENEPAENE